MSHQPCSAGLVGGTSPLAGIAVEVLTKPQEIGRASGLCRYILRTSPKPSGWCASAGHLALYQVCSTSCLSPHRLLGTNTRRRCRIVILANPLYCMKLRPQWSLREHPFFQGPQVTGPLGGHCWRIRTPPPLGGSGTSKGCRTLAWGRQKLLLPRVCRRQGVCRICLRLSPGPWLPTQAQGSGVADLGLITYMSGIYSNLWSLTSISGTLPMSETDI